MKRFTKAAWIGFLGLFVFTLYLMMGVVSYDVGYHCEFTGSKKSWTEWPFRVRSGYTYKISPLEKFLSERAPEHLEHKWVKYQGTGRTISGKPVFFGHGRPNALLTFPDSHLQAFVEQSPEELVLDLYEILRRNDRDEISQRIHQLYDESEPLYYKMLQQSSNSGG